MKTFFYNSKAEVDQTITLEKEEGYHAFKVLRSIKGEEVRVLNGQGDVLFGEISEISQKQCTITITHKISTEKKDGIHIALATIKNRDRMEWFVEKAVEFGAFKISFFHAERSERSKISIERMNKIAISALKQSGNAWLPEIEEYKSMAELIKSVNEQQRFICYIDEKEKKHLKLQYKPEMSAITLIGPEGDFTEKEIELAIEQKFEPTGLGENVLRAETAAIAALYTMKLAHIK